MEKKKVDYSQIGQERIITIADLIREVIRKLWLVLIAAVLFAVIAGGYKYYKDYTAAASAQTNENSMQQVIGRLSKEDQDEVNNILLIEDNMIEQQSYVENSVLMKINPYEESTVTLQYFFRTLSDSQEPEQDNNNTLMNLYQSYVDNGGLVADLAAAGEELDTQYLEELVSCEVRLGSSGDSSETNILEAGATTFNIKVIHVDEASCNELADRIESCIKNYGAFLNDTVTSHEITLMDRSYSEVVDTNLWTYKYDRVNSIVSMQERIDTLKGELTADQLNIIETYANESQNMFQQTDSTEEPTEKISVGISKKYVAVGALGGILLVCLFIIIFYILRGTINKADDLQYLYNIRVLGILNYKNKYNFFVMIWHKLLGQTDPQLSLNDQVKLLFSNLRITCQKNQIHKLLICGYNESEMDYMKAVWGRLKEQGIDIEYISNFLYSSEALDKLSLFGHVVFIEEIGKSRYSDIVKEIEVCMEQQADIVGAIVLD